MFERWFSHSSRWPRKVADQDSQDEGEYVPFEAQHHRALSSCGE